MKRIIYIISLAFFVFAAAPANAACVEALAAQTDAGESSQYEMARSNGIRGITFVIEALAGHTAAEYSDVQVSTDGGTTWYDVYINGAQARLHIANTITTVYGGGTYRVAKEATSNATKVSACLNDSQ